MLEYDFIYKKGILFIRLKGDINKKTSKVLVDEIDPLVLDNGIKNVVLNVGKLNNIDNDGILAIYDCYLKLTQEAAGLHSRLKKCTTIDLYEKYNYSWMILYNDVKIHKN